ncbi:hypothetical protein G7066_08035 [Leucobacter coleopterorum]|uniref:SseB protein N-terminal domain-containing protein n=1 Tax=Leucobacter coleopterorum TaxID=2714933 RepID=A0ABX6JZI1_9MICO|nr:hypothetical protein G7066_08035 [Leucobacter coleopterorum]
MIPPVLYLPIREVAEGQHAAEVRELPDARKALIAYTALDRLAENCGPAQPWILIQTDELGSIKDEQPFDVVNFDPQFSEHLIRNGRLV